MSDIFVVIGGAGLIGFAVGVFIVWIGKRLNRMRSRDRRFRYLA